MPTELSMKFTCDICGIYEYKQTVDSNDLPEHWFLFDVVGRTSEHNSSKIYSSLPRKKMYFCPWCAENVGIVIKPKDLCKGVDKNE